MTRAASAAPESTETPALPEAPNNDNLTTTTNNNNDDDTNIIATEATPTEANSTPTTEQERLFHAEVNVELTAEPITQIVTDMAVQARQNIINAKVAAVAAGTDNINDGDFDWVMVAQQAVSEAEVKAKEAVLELVGPVARSAWIEGRDADELEKGTPIIRDDGVGNGAERMSHSAGENGVDGGAIVASVKMLEEFTDGDEDTDAAPAEDDVAMADADAAPEAQDTVYEDPNRPLCFCRQPAYGETVYGCDGEGCRYEWYHESCLKRVLYKKNFPKPDKDWLCPYCGEYRVKAAMLPPKQKKSKV